MAQSKAVFETDLKSLPITYRGKVRDIYKLDSGHMLFVASDRLSAFDVILPSPIPGKGHVLTEISNFWFYRTADIVPNHLADLKPEDVVQDYLDLEEVQGRAVVVQELEPLPVEAIVRGYIIGSGWKEYQASGSVCGIAVPEGLRMADKLPQPIYTPSTKAEVGAHDENITFEQTVELLGFDMANQVRDISIQLYTYAAYYAQERGIIIADTKFEFGLNKAGDLVLMDEALTPDSSRFWPASTYRPGMSPLSFDKQYVRDYLETLDWDKKAPGPELPENIINKTAEKYAEALRLITGQA
ncbi:MAG: phosphoribosylaminoimidazolesuccinocarboxamide synthase [Gammaproteobacteria bacterium]